MGMTALNEAAQLLYSSDWALLLVGVWFSLILILKLGQRNELKRRQRQILNLKKKIEDLTWQLEESEETSQNWEQLYFRLLEKKSS